MTPKLGMEGLAARVCTKVGAQLAVTITVSSLTWGYAQ